MTAEITMGRRGGFSKLFRPSFAGLFQELSVLLVGLSTGYRHEWTVLERILRKSRRKAQLALVLGVSFGWKRGEARGGSSRCGLGADFVPSLCMACHFRNCKERAHLICAYETNSFGCEGTKCPVEGTSR